MSNYNSLCEEFKRYEGQPVEIFTDDGKVHCGIDLDAYADAVRIIDKCGRILLIEYSHIDAVVDPQMRLRKCCKNGCECNENGRGNGNGNDNGSSDFEFCD